MSFLTRAVLAALVVAAVGCGGDDNSQPAVPTITAPPATASTTPATTEAPTTSLTAADQDEADIRALAEAWYLVVREMFQGDAEPSAASEYLVEPYLGSFLEGFTERANDGSTVEFSDRSRQVVTEISIQGDAAEVLECHVDVDILLGADGEHLDDGVVSIEFASRAIREPDGWRLQSREERSTEEGDQCADSP